MNELSSYNKHLPGRIKLILLNKIDLCCFTNEIPEFNPIEDCKIIAISCKNNSGIESLKGTIEKLKI